MLPSKIRIALAATSLAVAGFAVALGPLAANAEPAPAAASSSLATATFASGCFWCAESDFEKVDGVVSVVSGYTGGQTKNPTYEQVGNGSTGHTEAIEIKFDPAKISYPSLVDYFFHHTDVVDGGGQFCDRGSQYRPAIFTHGDDQKKAAIEGVAALDKSGRFKQPVAVEIADATTFTAAEDYHQDYYKKNPIRYKFYRTGCGRDARLKALWGDDAAIH